MGNRGPQPTPTATLEARNSRRAKEDKRKNEIKLPTLPQPPDAPRWLSKEAKSLFKTTAEELHRAGLLTAVDADALGAYAERLAQYIELRDEASNTSLTFENEGMIRAHPIHKMRDEAHADCLRLRRELGMSPAARVGLTIDKPKPKVGEIVAIKGGFAT